MQKNVVRRKPSTLPHGQGAVERVLAPVTRPQRVAEQVYRHLRRAIVTGKIEPGTRLREVNLASALKVSRTPVREAISRLIGDWLVRELPTGGVEVVDIEDEVTDIFYIREALEVCAVRLAARRITPEQVYKLEELIERSEAATFKERVRINQRFHLAIAEASGSARLAEMISSFGEFYLNPRWVMVGDKEMVNRAIYGHRQIVTALRARSPDRCEKMLRAHLKMGWINAAPNADT
jgi:DNA-binding GntR family transcriptional regulator